MPVRRVSAKQMLGGKALVMFANPSLVKGLKKLREARMQSDLLAAAKDPSPKDNGG